MCLLSGLCSGVSVGGWLTAFGAGVARAGGLITRGYIERCNNPQVHNYITWSAPHGGVFGIPEFDMKWMDDLVQKTPYEAWVQNHISFAGYWYASLIWADVASSRLRCRKRRQMFR